MRDERRQELAELRRRQAREEAALTPTQRFERLERLRELARSLGAPQRSLTDEPPQLWVEQRRGRLARHGPARR